MGAPPGFVELIDGSLVERDVLNIVQKLQEYDSNLKVQYLDPNRASEPGDAPYQILELDQEGRWRLVFKVWELNDSVIDRIRAADMRNPEFLKNMDAHNMRIRMESKRRYEEKMLEAADITKHVISSPKGRYTIPSADGEGVVLVDDTAPERRIK